MSAWILAKDLERVAAASDDPDLRELCALLREQYLYPVSSHVVATDGGIEHLAALDVNAGMTGGGSGYRRFLLGALGEDAPGPSREE